MLQLLIADWLIKNLDNYFMTAAFLPPILTPIVTLVFPGIIFALFFILIEQEEENKNF